MNENHKSILLVEDEHIIAMMTKMELEGKGYLVHYAASGEAAVKTVLEDSFPADLILMDIDLGAGMDGTQAARQILDHKDIPVVFLSSHTEPEIVEKTEKITSYGYVAKNSGIFVLDVTIKMALKLFNEKMERMRAEEALKVSQLITENIPVGLHLYHLEDLSDDRTLRMVYANPAVRNLTGIGPEEVVGKTLDENFPGLRSQGIPQKYAEVVRSQCAIAFDDIVYEDDRVILASFSVKAFPLPGSHVGVAFENITERKQGEEQIERLAQIADIAPCSIVVHDLNGKIMYFNKRICQALGYEKEEFMHMSLEQINPPENAEWIPVRIKEIEEKGGAEFEVTHIKKDGSTIPSIIYAKKIEWFGEPAILSVGIDITERKQAEQELIKTKEKAEESKNQLNATLNALPDLLFEIDKYTKIYDYRAPNTDLLYVSPSEFLGKNMTDVLPKEANERILYGIEKANEFGKYSGIEYSLQLPNGLHWFDMSIALKSNDQNNRYVMIVRDITERKQAEQVIARLLKEKEILLKEVHHRVKNNFLSVQSFLAVQARNAANSVVKAALEAAAARVQSSCVLYDKLLLSKEYEAVSTKNYMESLLVSLKEVYPDSGKITVEKNISDFSLETKKALSVGIILNELLTNIFKYAFTGREAGRVSVALEKSGNTVTLTVQDDGIGFDARERMNESPGFGMTIVKMLAEQLQGTYSSVKDNGTKSVLKFNV